MLLEVEDLVTQFRTKRGIVQAVDHVSFSLDAGEALGIVGESGSGKSAVAQSVMGLIAPPGRIAGGRILFEGENLLDLPAEAKRRIRGARVSMIFQDPTSTLNPVLPIGEQIAELLHHHTRLGGREVWRRVIEMLDLVGIPNAATRVRSYPHELSGGMQQRVIIACALILRPKLVIADEPTTALDVTVQAQILDLLRQLQESERNTAIILITHDLGVVAQLCQRICVMYAGRIVEMGSTTEILQSPKHPYTIGLIGSIPRLGADQGELQPIPGTVPDLVDPPSGCRFHPRCSQAMARCAQERPPLLPEAGGTRVACHLFEGLA